MNYAFVTMKEGDYLDILWPDKTKVSLCLHVRESIVVMDMHHWVFGVRSYMPAVTLVLYESEINLVSKSVWIKYNVSPVTPGQYTVTVSSTNKNMMVNGSIISG